jgi:hypothetical protein
MEVGGKFAIPSLTILCVIVIFEIERDFNRCEIGESIPQLSQLESKIFPCVQEEAFPDRYLSTASNRVLLQQLNSKHLG